MFFLIIQTMKKLRIFLVSFFMLGAGFYLYGQTAIPATGSNATGTGGAVSYTIGQLVYEITTAAGGSVIQGVQQPYEISVISSLEEVPEINLQVSVFPNPAEQYLILRIDEPEPTLFRYLLFDMSGKLLQYAGITDSETRILTAHLVPAIYLIKIMQGNREIKTFKIIKH